MNFVAFDVLIKISESYRPQIPLEGHRKFSRTHVEPSCVKSTRLSTDLRDRDSSQSVHSSKIDQPMRGKIATTVIGQND